MRTRIQIALMGCFLSVAMHLYLAMHYYPLKLGIASGQSLCNLNKVFNCDDVAASKFSALFGIPMAVWGTVTNAILFGLILMSWLEWTEHPERLRRWTTLLSGGTVIASVIMGAISLLLMNSYCVFCISLYILSLIIFFSYRKILREPFWSNIGSDLPHLWSENRGVVISFASIPVLAFLLHSVFLDNLDSGKVNAMVEESLRDWESSPKFDFVAKPSLVKGPAAEKASLTLVEFADFRCPHCKHASYSLHAFVNANPDVRFEFYSFPLDGSCNPKMDHSDGISCRLAAALICADKESKGWEAHDMMFEVQDETRQMGSVGELDVLLSKKFADLGMNWESIQVCLGDSATTEAVQAQAKQGDLVNIRGTPTLFAEGKMLGRIMVPLLQQAREKSLANKNR
ncbi:MAG: vitamin K epoxide reductase family protein [Bdellovibrionales bacterium]